MDLWQENIITNPRLKQRMLKFQFMTIRKNVTRDITKVTKRNNFRNISIPNSKSILRFWFLPQQRTIWSNMTNNTTKVTDRHKNRFIMLSNSRIRLRFRNFSVYIKTFTLPSKISLFFFIIHLEMRDTNFLSFRLKRNRNTSIINSRLGTSQIFNFSFRFCEFLDPLKHNWINLVN